jgi:hypothetical protein
MRQPPSRIFNTHSHTHSLSTRYVIYCTLRSLMLSIRSSHASPHTQPLPGLDPNALTPFQKVILVKVRVCDFESENVFCFFGFEHATHLRHVQLNYAFRFKLFFSSALIPFVTISHRLSGPTARYMPFAPLSFPLWAPSSGGDCFLDVFVLFCFFVLHSLHNHTVFFLFLSFYHDNV